MGGSCNFFFSQFNPNGRYKIDLKVDKQREIAKNLILLNKDITARITAKELCDRSQQGNKSCFRNERISGARFEMSNSWNLPDAGIFEFDFVCFGDVPTKEQESSEEELQALKIWF